MEWEQLKKLFFPPSLYKYKKRKKKNTTKDQNKAGFRWIYIYIFLKGLAVHPKETSVGSQWMCVVGWCWLEEKASYHLPCCDSMCTYKQTNKQTKRSSTKAEAKTAQEQSTQTRKRRSEMLQKHVVRRSTASSCGGAFSWMSVFLVRPLNVFATTSTKLFLDYITNLCKKQQQQKRTLVFCYISPSSHFLNSFCS